MYQILFLLLFIQPPQIEKHLLNHGPIQNIFEVKGIDISGNTCTIPIINGIVPTMIESTKNGTKYYIFDYANRRPYSEFNNATITYSSTVKAFKEEVKNPISKVTKPELPKRTYPPPTIIEKNELNLKRPSEVGKPN